LETLNKESARIKYTSADNRYRIDDLFEKVLVA